MPRISTLVRTSLIFASLWLGSSATARADNLTIFSTGQQGTVLLAINASTGAATTVGPLGLQGAVALGFSPTGVLYTVANGFPPGGTAIEQLATVNPATGRATLVGSPFPFRVGVMPMAVSFSSTIFAAGTAPGSPLANRLLIIDPVTGQPSAVGPLGVTGMMDFAFAPSGTLYGATQTALYTINTGTGAATLVAPFSGGGIEMVMGITFDRAGNLFATNFSAASSLFSVNASTGVATLVGQTGVPFVHSAETSPIPEPATMILLGTGLAGVAAKARKRRRAAADQS